MPEDFTKASKPHERLMFNLAIFHFLLPAILFGTENLWLVVGLPLLGSCLFIASIARQAFNAKGKTVLVQAHWQLAWKRSRYLLLAYVVATALFLIGFAVVQIQPDKNMRMIQLAVAGWFSLIPVSVVVALLIIVESSALAQAGRGVMPENMKL